MPMIGTVLCFLLSVFHCTCGALSAYKAPHLLDSILSNKWGEVQMDAAPVFA